MHVRLQKVHGMKQPGCPIVRIMNAQTPATNAPGSPFEAVPAPRMRPALRKAVMMIAEQGRTQRDAAARAGLNEKSLSRALQRPEISNYLEYCKALSAIDADKLKGQARVIAIRTGIELLNDAKSEQVRARMVEFFAGEARQAGVAVQVNVGPNAGYVYAKPDTLSGGTGSQVVDITPQEPEAAPQPK